MVEIRVIDILSYLLEFSERLSYLAYYYASLGHRSVGGVILGAYRDGSPCGMAALSAVQGEKSLTIEFVAVMEECRRQGIGKAILRECLEHARREAFAEVRCRITENSEVSAGMTDLLNRIGFRETRFSVTAAINLSKTTVCEWFCFLKKRGNRLLKRLERTGFVTLSYSEAGEWVLEEIRKEAGKRFPADMEPVKSHLITLRDNSYVTLKAGVPVAYCQLATVDGGKNVMVPSLASAFDSLHRGAFFPCLAFVVTDALTVTGAEKCAFTYYGTNSEMKKMCSDFLRFSDASYKRQSFLAYQYGTEDGYV